MKYIKTVKDNKVLVQAVPNSFTEKELPDGFTFTTKKFFQRVKKHNEKMAVISGNTKKGKPNVIRAVTKEHLKYGNLFVEKNGRPVLKEESEIVN